MPFGAILLVGGRSTRMGHPKANLDWHGEPLAARLARVLARAVGEGPVVLVRAPGQELPDLPAGLEIVDDPAGGDGPLRGLATGLAALEDRVEIAIAASVDLPFLTAPFVAAMLAAIEDDDAAIPVAHDRRHPLPAAYRVALRPLCDELLAHGERRLRAVFEEVATRFVAVGDVDVKTLRNINTPADYEAARAVPPPLVSVQGVVRRAWRLEQAFDGLVAVNGVPIESDPWYPLAPGDRISLIDESHTA
jgi:molybdenum cofactor guanylyltransferase